MLELTVNHVVSYVIRLFGNRIVHLEHMVYPEAIERLCHSALPANRQTFQLVECCVGYDHCITLRHFYQLLKADS